MKRKILIFIVVVGLSFISGCYNKSNNSITFKDDFGYLTPNNITYKFYGISEHFGFETGKVYYGEENERYILITNFKIINELTNQDEIEKYSFNLSFNNVSMFTDDMTNIGTANFEDKISESSIEEMGTYPADGFGESDAFLESTKDNFKDSVKFEIKYCYKDGLCKVEKLDLKYVEN